MYDVGTKIQIDSYLNEAKDSNQAPEIVKEANFLKHGGGVFKNKKQTRKLKLWNNGKLQYFDDK